MRRSASRGNTAGETGCEARPRSGFDPARAWAPATGRAAPAGRPAAALFGRLDAKTLLETESGQVMARLVSERADEKRR
jgi:hypothetical protein